MGAKIDFQNCSITAWTVTAPRREQYTNSWDVTITAASVSRSETSRQLASGETLDERYEQTLAWIELLTRAGYMVKYSGNASSKESPTICERIPLSYTRR